MIYMVEHIFMQANAEPAWNEWYTGYLHKLLCVPGFGRGTVFWIAAPHELAPRAER